MSAPAPVLFWVGSARDEAQLGRHDAICDPDAEGITYDVLPPELGVSRERLCQLLTEK